MLVMRFSNSLNFDLCFISGVHQGRVFIETTWIFSGNSSTFFSLLLPWQNSDRFRISSLVSAGVVSKYSLVIYQADNSIYERDYLLAQSSDLLRQGYYMVIL